VLHVLTDAVCISALWFLQEKLDGYLKTSKCPKQLPKNEIKNPLQRPLQIKKALKVFTIKAFKFLIVPCTGIEPVIPP
jgi:phage FluMu protein Com